MLPSIHMKTEATVKKKYRHSIYSPSIKLTARLILATSGRAFENMLFVWKDYNEDNSVSINCHTLKRTL